ncbi:hypothetical protein BXY85_3851 [Roseivirga pacifica]|uniref:Uncharacterized protein n=1 Tax=Roseivirga pacifica TaxID=1267423 RepID=A0A1I0Q547_9BACT|nr:hypothetical protein [Roseivirga pacifica]RKQ43232.1 hypothetical protein BXY85_3851 [Roseivirga pacifica]SEW22098.1 hypothetical protein SAMN05216290_2024 [Roseivirga pacifica]
MTKKSKGPGAFISQKKAIQQINAFFDHQEKENKKNGTKWSPKKDYYAFAFGLDKVQELMAKIEKYNANNPDNPIGGIRVVSARSNKGVAVGPDVVIVPYLAKTGKNYIPVDQHHDDAPDTATATLMKSSFENDGTDDGEEDDDDGMLLNGSLPCPPYCNDPDTDDEG